MAKETPKRLLANVPEDAYWDIKKSLGEYRLKMRDLLPMSVAYILGLPLTPEYLELGEDGQETIDRFLALAETRKLERRK